MGGRKNDTFPGRNVSSSALPPQGRANELQTKRSNPTDPRKPVVLQHMCLLSLAASRQRTPFFSASARRAEGSKLGHNLQTSFNNNGNSLAARPRQSLSSAGSQGATGAWDAMRCGGVVREGGREGEEGWGGAGLKA